MAWEATDETVPVSGGKWTEEQPTTWLGRAGQTAVDLATAAGHAATFGMDVRRDALSGWLAGDYPSYSAGVEAEQKKLEKQRERSPYASIAGDVTGAVLIPGMGGAGLAARLGTGLGRWGQAGARAAGYGLEGAAVGAAQGAGGTYSGKPLDYAGNALVGGGVGGVLGAGMGSVFGPRGGMRSSADVPTTPQLYAEKQANYRALEQSPARYEPGAFARAADPVETSLRGQRFHESRSPATFQALDEMRGAPTAFPLGAGTPVSPADIDFIRKGVTNLNPVTEATDIASAREVKRALDSFVRNPPPGAVMPGTEAAATEAAAIANRAHGNYAGYKRAQMFDDIMENAQTIAGSQHSGLNLQNKLRQGVGAGLRQKAGMSPFSKAGYNDAEIAALTDFARVPRGDASLRYMDRLFGGGGGLGAVAAGGVGGGAVGHYFKDDPAMGTAAGVAIPAAGLALRTIGNRRATRNMQELSDMVRRRNPLYQQRAATAPMILPPGGGVPASVRDAMTLEILRQQGVSREE